ncbi:hypothetical protein V8F20_011465 [Naviculisporaceae sp. PSN 640]
MRYAEFPSLKGFNSLWGRLVRSCPSFIRAFFATTSMWAQSGRKSTTNWLDRTILWQILSYTLIDPVLRGTIHRPLHYPPPRPDLLNYTQIYSSYCKPVSPRWAIVSHAAAVPRQNRLPRAIIKISAKRTFLCNPDRASHRVTATLNITVPAAELGSLPAAISGSLPAAHLVIEPRRLRTVPELENLGSLSPKVTCCTGPPPLPLSNYSAQPCNEHHYRYVQLHAHHRPANTETTIGHGTVSIRLTFSHVSYGMVKWHEVARGEHVPWEKSVEEYDNEIQQLQAAEEEPSDNDDDASVDEIMSWSTTAVSRRWCLTRSGIDPNVHRTNRQLGCDYNGQWEYRSTAYDEYATFEGEVKNGWTADFTVKRRNGLPGLIGLNDVGTHRLKEVGMRRAQANGVLYRPERGPRQAYSEQNCLLRIAAPARLQPIQHNNQPRGCLY